MRSQVHGLARHPSDALQVCDASGGGRGDPEAKEGSYNQLSGLRGQGHVPRRAGEASARGCVDTAPE